MRSSSLQRFFEDRGNRRVPGVFGGGMRRFGCLDGVGGARPVVGGFRHRSWRGPRGRRAIALTFDDGPSESTPAILDILARHGVRATFFQCGANVERLPSIARAVRSAGHEIGNHSQTHPFFCLRSPRFMLDQLQRAQDSIEVAPARGQSGSAPPMESAGPASARRSGDWGSLA